MWLAVVVVAALSAQILWECNKIRAGFADMGMRLTRIRWLPFRPLFDGRWSRRRMHYRVEYTDRSGAPCTCVAVWTLFQGLSLEGQRPRHESGSRPSQSPGIRMPWPALTCSSLGCIAIGAEYWVGPYNQVNLPNGLFTFGLLALGIAAVVLHALQPERWRSTVPLLALAPVATVLVRIVMDVSRDPTTHNLLPFEIVIAAFVGGVVSLSGTALGWLVARVVGPPRASAGVRVRAVRARSTSRTTR